MAYQIDDKTAVRSLPAPDQENIGEPGFFTDGDPSTGEEATVIPSWWLNMVQQELLAPVAAAGLSPDKSNNGQLLAAIKKLSSVLMKLSPFSADYVETRGGYPTGTLISHPTIAGRLLICTQDGNTNDPSQNMTGWDDPIADLSSQFGREFIANNYEIPSNGTPALGLWSDVNGQPQYTDAANGTRALALQSAPQSGYRLLNRQVWATGGSYTYTPTAGTRAIIVRLCGAGGGGGGAQGSYAQVSLGLGGNGGTYAESNLLTVPASPTSVVVGAGGAGGAVGFNNGSNGGLSSVGTLITAPGGPGGGAGNPTNAGQVGHTSWQQTPGPAGNVSITVLGSVAEALYAAGSNAVVIPSRGGASFFGPGSNGYGNSGAWNGNDSSPAVLNGSSGSANPAFITGAGGAGATTNGGGTAAGGSGADGIVIIEEYC